MELSDKVKLEKYLIGDMYKPDTSPITNFYTSGAVYKWTNENFKLYPKDNLENKKVLTITSSGDHALDAILKGATDIDSIDINEFSKYVSALKIAMIKKYDCLSFAKKFRIFTAEGIMSTLLFQILDEISVYLTDKEVSFWNAYAHFIKTYENKRFAMNINALFENDGGSFDKNEYYDQKQYNVLKDKLDGVTIKYYDGDIVNLDEIAKDNMYDIIYLSNIIEKINTNTTSKDRFELVDSLLKKMNKNAIIYNYLFKCGKFLNNSWSIKELFIEYYEEFNGKITEGYYYNPDDYSIYSEAQVSIRKK